MRLAVRIAMLAGLLFPVIGATGHAADAKPDDAIKYRQAMMEILGGHTGAFFAIFMGKVPQTDALAYHARALADATAYVEAAFQQNTAGKGDAKTKAKDKIWTEWDQFAKKVADLKAAAATLAEASESGDMDQIKAAAGPLGNACKSCHDDYREK